MYEFTQRDFNETCILIDGRVGMIIQINMQVEPFDVAVQVHGEPEARIITWDKFDMPRGVIEQVKK